MRPLRILFNVWADRQIVNAQCLNARDIAVRLDPGRFRVSMYCRKDPDAAVAAAAHIDLIAIPTRLGTVVQLRHLLSSRYDMVFYAAMGRSAVIHRWLKKRGVARRPLVSPVENVLGDRSAMPGHIRRYWESLAEVSDIAVANSPFVAASFHEAFGRSIPVIPSGVDTFLIRRIAAGPKPPGDGRLTIAFAGSLQERKHPELVVEAARIFPGSRFVIMGSGPLEGALARRIAEHGLGNVDLVPTTDYRSYLENLVRADIFLFPSRVEGLPKVTLEAAAAGIPVVVFKDYQTPSVVDGVTGYQVGTFEEMVDRLEILVSREDLRRDMGEAGMRHAASFDWESIVQAWSLVFESVAGGRGTER